MSLDSCILPFLHNCLIFIFIHNLFHFSVAPKKKLFLVAHSKKKNKKKDFSKKSKKKQKKGFPLKPKEPQNKSEIQFQSLLFLSEYFSTITFLSALVSSCGCTSKSRSLVLVS